MPLDPADGVFGPVQANSRLAVATPYMLVCLFSNVKPQYGNPRVLTLLATEHQKTHISVALAGGGGQALHLVVTGVGGRAVSLMAGVLKLGRGGPKSQGIMGAETAGEAMQMFKAALGLRRSMKP